jgi:hypothetical protein
VKNNLLGRFGFNIKKIKKAFLFCGKKKNKRFYRREQEKLSTGEDLCAYSASLILCG